MNESEQNSMNDMHDAMKKVFYCNDFTTSTSKDTTKHTHRYAYQIPSDFMILEFYLHMNQLINHLIFTRQHLCTFQFPVRFHSPSWTGCGRWCC